MADENGSPDKSTSKSLLAVDTTSGETRRLETEEVAGQSALVVKAVAGVAAGDIGKAEDSAHASGDVGIMALGVRNDGGDVKSGANGDYEPLPVSSYGSMAGVPVHIIGDGDKFVRGILAHDAADTGIEPVVIGGRAATSEPSAVSNGDIVRLYIDENGYARVKLGAGTANIGDVDILGGNVAHDAADSGNPVKTGSRAVSDLNSATLVAAADRTDNVSDLDGALINRPQFPLGDIISERVSNTNGTSTAFSNFGAVSGKRYYITAIHVYNASATAGFVDFRDGTAGSVLYTLALPAGGGAVLAAGATPYFRTTANTALAFDVSAALTTVYISITGFLSKI